MNLRHADDATGEAFIADAALYGRHARQVFAVHSNLGPAARPGYAATQNYSVPITPLRTAYWVSSAAPRMPSFCMMWALWVCTVFSLMYNNSAISRLL